MAAVIALATATAGALAALHYAHLGLTLAHYDARAHLVVARRIVDSLTPGWQQIGAVWLPLPHVLNALPVQLDFFYRTGAFAVAISIASMAIASGSLASMVVRITGSRAAAVAGAVLLLGNPNVLYLQSTPMTEPLLFGTTLLAIAWTADWVDRGATGWPTRAGLALVAACMTRYEAWPMAVALGAGVVLVLLRRGTPIAAALGASVRLGLYPAVALLIFVANSRWTVGAWFVSTGFFVAENVEALGHPLAALHQVFEGLEKLAGTALLWSAYASAVIVVASFALSRTKASLLLAGTLFAAAALPWYAYLHGHPFRIRYDVPLVIAAAALIASAIAMLRPRILQWVAAALVGGLTLWQVHPLDASAPMVVEAQRDRQNMAGRQAVTAHLTAHYDGGTIMMSMGSLAHYMQDLSAQDFRIQHFLHEGNGEIWRFAMLKPRGHAEWLVIEEQAEGGDALAIAARRDPRWLDGFDRVALGGGVALYRATPK